MEQAAPDFLSTEFLTQCLQQDPEYKDIVVVSFSSELAVPLGEQYCSCPTRVKVVYKRSEDSVERLHLPLIVKSQLKEGAVKEVIDSFDCSESVFYSSFLPKVIALTGFPFAAKCFSSPKPSVIILEDLKEKGFVTGNKSKGLNFEHCRLYVAAVASLHAASLAVLEEDPEYIRTIGKEKLYCYGQPLTDGLKVMGSMGMRCLAEYTETSEKFKQYAEIIKESSVFIFDLAVEAVKPREEELNAMNHGDAWINNMMFRYDERGSPCEVKLLDFQLTRYSTPLIDIVYFIWTSADDDVRTKRLEELYRFYVEELNKSLRLIHRPERMSYENVMGVVKRLIPFAISSSVLIQIFAAERAVVNLEPFFTKGQEEESFQIYKTVFSDEKFCKDRLPKLVEQLELAGVFEHLKQSIASKAT